MIYSSEFLKITTQYVQCQENCDSTKLSIEHLCFIVLPHKLLEMSFVGLCLYNSEITQPYNHVLQAIQPFSGGCEFNFQFCNTDFNSDTAVSPQSSKLATAGRNNSAELDSFALLSVHTQRETKGKQRSDRRQLFQFDLSVEKALLRESHYISGGLCGNIVSFRVLDSSTYSMGSQFTGAINYPFW